MVCLIITPMANEFASWRFLKTSIFYVPYLWQKLRLADYILDHPVCKQECICWVLSVFAFLPCELSCTWTHFDFYHFSTVCAVLFAILSTFYQGQYTLHYSLSFILCQPWHSLAFYSVIGSDWLYLCYVLPVTSLELDHQRFDYSLCG